MKAIPVKSNSIQGLAEKMTDVFNTYPDYQVHHVFYDKSDTVTTWYTALIIMKEKGVN